VPDHILMSIAVALATRSVNSLFDLVKQHFANRQEAAAALEAAQGAGEGSTEAATLARHLEQAVVEDPVFAADLRQMWQHANPGRGSVVNQIAGNVSGKVVQARDINGNVTF
jgi:hypothetical protein